MVSAGVCFVKEFTGKPNVLVLVVGTLGVALVGASGFAPSLLLGVIGGLLVLTGILFLTGSMTDMAFWILETFPTLGRIG